MTTRATRRAVARLVMEFGAVVVERHASRCTYTQCTGEPCTGEFHAWDAIAQPWCQEHYRAHGTHSTRWRATPRANSRDTPSGDSTAASAGHTGTKQPPSPPAPTNQPPTSQGSLFPDDD